MFNESLVDLGLSELKDSFCISFCKISQKRSTSPISRLNPKILKTMNSNEERKTDSELQRKLSSTDMELSTDKELSTDMELLRADKELLRTDKELLRLMLQSLSDMGLKYS
jgi:hypothetical protein